MERKEIFYQKLVPIILSYVLGILYVRGMFFSPKINGQYVGMDMVLLVFAVGLLFWTEYVCHGRERKKEVSFWYGCTVLIPLSFVVEAGPYMGRDVSGIVVLFMYFCLHAIAVYAILVRGGWLISEKTSGYFILDLFYGMVILPFANLFLRLRMLSHSIKTLFFHKVEKKNLLTSSCVIIGSIFFLLYAISLLSVADDNFSKIFEQFTLSFWTTDFLIEQFILFIISLPIGMYLFGVLMGGVVNKVKVYDREKLEEFGKKCHLASCNILTIVLLLFCIVYGIYLWLQAGYFFGAFTGNLPEGFTFAMYARQGFFELCNIIGLNIFLFWIVVKISQSELGESKGLRIVSFLFHGQGILFVVTAFAKVVLYIRAYGFTTLRLMSLWVIMVLLAAIILAIGYMFGVKNVAKKWIYFMVGTFTIVCYL